MKEYRAKGAKNNVEKKQKAINTIAYVVVLLKQKRHEDK